VGSSLFTSPTRSLLQCGLPTRSQPPSGIHLLQGQVLHRLRVDICSTVDLHRLQVDSLSHRGLHHGLQENLCSGAWSTYSPSSFTNHGICRVVSLTYSHSSLLLQLLLCRFFPLLQYVIPEALPPSLIGTALASGRSILGPAGTGSIRHDRKLLTAAHRSHPSDPPATKTLPHKPTTTSKLSQNKESLLQSNQGEDAFSSSLTHDFHKPCVDV